ncbi:MAG: hypothetical protein WCF30_18055 [Terracidiphilus sp.]
MNTQLRPMTLGEILDRTAELYRTHFLLFAGISSIFAVVMLAVQLLYLRSLVLLGYPNMMVHWRWGTASVAVVEALVVLMLAGLSIAANNRAVAWVYLDKPATIRAAAKSVLPRLRTYLWLMTITAFRAWAPFAALYVTLIGVAFAFLPHGFMSNPTAAQDAAQQNSGAFMALGLGMLVLMPFIALALLYGVWMSLRYSLAVPACVVEDLPATRAIKRSIELSLGSRGRIFVLGLLVYAVRTLLGILFGFPMIALALKHPGQPLPLPWMVLAQIGSFVTSALIGPIYSTGLTLFYYDQRIRKEGFDIEWMMQAAGLSPQTELPAPHNP